MTLQRLRNIITVSALAAFLLAGCSAEKNTGSSRFYHALISKYNIYFNGNEAYKKGVEKVKAANRDDYTNLLPVFEYSAPGSENACAGDMERAVQKASKVIALHSITAKPEREPRRELSERDEAFMKQKEYNVWVDDSYLLMAKAQFYQKKFREARTTISYLRDMTTDTDLLSEASIWYSRILIEEKNLNLAESTLRDIQGSESFSPALKSMYASTYADLLLRQKRYGEAVSQLQTALRESTDKGARLRYTYLLAQLYQQQGDDQMSTKYFREVIRMKPPYELEFNAGINLTGVADISSGEQVADLRKILMKMLTDVKNKDYLDQIYFALGELSRRQGDMTAALESYHKSANMSSVNTRQKGKAYLALGSYYYSLPDYTAAHHYYDSAMAIIDENYPDHRVLKERAAGLKEYYDFHVIVAREDSLRRIALMSAPERERVIQKIITDAKAQKVAETMDGSRDMANLGRSYENEQRYRDNISQEGSWYFYNQTALTFGRTEFRRRWGTRRLEDNWRRQNKARVITSPDEENNAPGLTPGNEGERGSVPDDQTAEYYLKNLPLTDSLMALSLDRSTMASLNEGKILASRLHDTVAATAALEAALAQGAAPSTRAEALYNLYTLEKETNAARADRWHDMLLSEYPESEYALILSDPDYVRKQAETAGLCTAMYNNAYYNFKQGAYKEVMSICDEALAKYPDSELVPKFMLLQAMATGGLTGEYAYKTALDTLVARYPDTPEGGRAKEIIDYLMKQKPEIKVAEDTRIAESIYYYDPGQAHYCMIIASNTSANLNQIVFDIINYNLDNYQEKGYRTEGTTEQGKYLMITVSIFADASEAQAYLDTFDAQKVIRGADGARLSFFVISRDNLEQFRTDKNPERYRIFYEANYLNQTTLPR